MIYTTAYDPYKTLLEVALENEHCDKISHGYCELYHKHFSTVRNLPSTRVLEIGTLVGLSSRLFRSYFHPDATIHTIDINDCKKYLPEKVEFTQMNTQLIPSLQSFAETQGKWDIIIDDGGHDMLSQQNSIQYLWDVVKPGGYFVMEDIHSSFMSQFQPSDPKISTYHLMKCLADPSSTFSSPWMTTETFEKIRGEIELVEFFQRDPNLWTDSITSIVKKR